jgi:hypothetical protein
MHRWQYGVKVGKNSDNGAAGNGAAGNGAAGNGAAAGAAPAAPPESLLPAGQEQAIAPPSSSMRAPPPDKEMTVDIGGAKEKITTSFFLAGNIADVFRIDTTQIPKFNKRLVRSAICSSTRCW